MSNFPKLIATLLREGTGNFSVPETVTERDLERLIEKLRDNQFKRSINDVVMHTFPKRHNNGDHDLTFTFLSPDACDSLEVVAPNLEAAYCDIVQQHGWALTTSEEDDDD